MQHGELRSDRGSRLVNEFFLQFSSTSMTASRQERNHPTSSSSSFTSPTTTVLSDSETREGEDLSGIDSHPVFVSSSHVEEIERRDPLLPKPTQNPKPNKNENHEKERRDPSDILEWLQEFRENLVDDRVPEHRDTHTPVLPMKYL